MQYRRLSLLAIKVLANEAKKILTPYIFKERERSVVRHELRAIARGRIFENVPLAHHSRWKVGGNADVLVEPCNVNELAAIVALAKRLGSPLIVVGDSSNLLFDDAGFHGIIVRLGQHFSSFEIGEDGLATAGAGIWVPSFVRNVINRGLKGATHAIGIPGTLGGLIAMNGGSQRKGIGDYLVSALSLKADGDLARYTQESCNFGYRTSKFQASCEIIIEAEFLFEQSDVATLRREALEILVSRRLKFPKKLPNCGSVFASNPAMYASVGPPGHAIELTGLKGVRLGQAEISPMHANFINNLGGARSCDVLELIYRMRTRVFELTGYYMESEVRHVSPSGTIRAAHEAAELQQFNQWR